MTKSAWRDFLALHFSKWPLVLAGAIALAVLGVAELSDDVMEGDTQKIDEWALLLFRHAGDPAQPLGPPWVQQAMVDITALGSHAVLVIVSLLAAGYCLLTRRGDIFGFLFLSAFGAVWLNAGLKLLFSRERPVIVEPLVQVSSFSYPSGHALMSAAIYLSFAIVFAEIVSRRRARAYILCGGFLLAGLTGVSRIYLGVHYLTDVVAGWAIGGVWALGCWLALRVLRPPTARENNP